MTATEKLRRMLDERGVEWWEATPCKTKWYSPIIGGPVAARVWNGEMVLDVGYVNVTPEQAIDATLGRGTCENVGYYIDSTRFKCSACEYNGWTRYAAYGEDRVPRYCPNCGRKVANE